jgi:hypothetical protein
LRNLTAVKPLLTAVFILAALGFTRAGHSGIRSSTPYAPSEKLPSRSLRLSGDWAAAKVTPFKRRPPNIAAVGATLIGVRLSTAEPLATPSPLVGEGWGGGSCRGAQQCKTGSTPSPQGGGEEFAASLSLNLTPMGATLVVAPFVASGNRATTGSPLHP